MILRIAAAVVVALLPGGCGGDRAGAPPTTSTGPVSDEERCIHILEEGGTVDDCQDTTTSQPPSPDLADCQRRPSGSSPAIFDASGGTYAAQSLAVLGGRTLEFDVVQWLSGEDADEAYLRESGDDSGAPNDYYIVNERDELRTAQVADEATILVLRADGEADSLHAVPLGAIPTDDPHRTFWLTFDDGVITEVCQQYRP